MGSQRFFVSLLTALRSYSYCNIDFLLLFLMIIYSFIHCVMRPFKWKRLNIVEGVCLFSLLLVIGSSPYLNRDNQTFTEIFTGIVIIWPLFFVFIYAFIAIRNVTHKTAKQIEKVKLRAPVGITNEIDDFEDSMDVFGVQQTQKQIYSIVATEIEIGL